MKSIIIFGLITIFSFPLVIGSLFMISYLMHLKIYAGKAGIVFGQRQFYLYFLFLLLFFLAIFYITIRANLLSEVGMKLPFELLEMLMVGVGILVGIILYYNELYLSLLFKKILKSLSFFKKTISERNINISNEELLNFPVLVLLSIGISFFEEFIWRGFLITALKNDFSLSLGSSVMLSSLSFGMNHYYFGLRTVVLKFLAGIIWGMLFVSTSNILIPFISHTTFNIWAWRKQT